MIVIKIEQRGLSKHLGPLDISYDAAVRLVNRLRTRADQLKVVDLKIEINPLTDWDGGNLTRALSGFAAFTTISEEDDDDRTTP